MDISRYDQRIQELYNEQQSRLQMMDAGVLSVLRQMLKHAKMIRDDALIGYVYHSMSFAEFFITGRYEAFLKYTALAAKHLFRCEDRSELMHVYYLVGVDALNKGLHDIAYHLFMSARTLAAENGQKTAAAILDESIGHIFIQIGDYQKARRFLKKSLKVVSRDPEHPHYFNNVTSCYLNVAEVYLSLGLLKEARQDYENAMRFMEETPHEFMLDVELSFVMLGLRLAIYDKDGFSVGSCFAKLLELLEKTDSITIYINDMYKLVKTFIEAEELSLAGELVDVLSEKNVDNNASEARRVFIETRIAYYTAINDSDKLMKCYMEQDRIYARLVTEQRDSNKYTSEIINLANKLQEEQEAVVNRRAELLRQAETDPLTELPNRYASNIHMDEAFERAYLEKTSFAAGILDMDNLKEYNDRLGHVAGDELLRELSNALRRACDDPRCFVARYGGDEFILIFVGMKDREITDVMSPVLKSTKAEFSLGICSGIPSGKQKSWDYLAAADEELYKIKNKKHQGRFTDDISICHIAR